MRCCLYEFPTEHWDHSHTITSVESVCAAVRGHVGLVVPTTSKLMVFKQIIVASKTWCRLKGTNQLPKLVGVKFNDGIDVFQEPANHAA